MCAQRSYLLRGSLESGQELCTRSRRGTPAPQAATPAKPPPELLCPTCKGDSEHGLPTQMLQEGPNIGDLRSSSPPEAEGWLFLPRFQRWTAKGCSPPTFFIVTGP